MTEMTKPSVTIVDFMGDDKAVAQFARQSIGGDGLDEKGVRRLIRFLMRHGHTSVFARLQVVIEVTCPIFTARQWLRAGVGWRYCEQSLRYKTLDMPDFLPFPDEEYSAWANLYMTDAFDTYHELVREGVNREDARRVLPLSTMTKFQAVVSVEALLHFFDKRLPEDAQHDIREQAWELYSLVYPLFPYVMAAYRDYRMYRPMMTHTSVIDEIREILRGSDFAERVGSMDFLGDKEREEVLRTWL